MTARTLTTKGLATRQALEEAARMLFAQRGFHGTTLSDITAAAGRSPASFYRYFADKEELLAALAQDFLRDVVELPKFSDDNDFFVSAVGVYWQKFKPNIGIMVAIDQLAATEPRFALLQNQFRRFGMGIVGASVRTAQQQGYGTELDADHIALAIALLFERFTSVSLSQGLSDDAAVTTLSTIWKKTIYGTLKKE
ncbi:MAG TPA: TetR/AcrR family transcriptional regulator [Mycobacterium sp.]|uniref:TetR/AcrR family transcriptional regulator n=1 Tax=Mycolicibacterium sp. TaxID=2320850 RepID=UPI0025CCFAD4|nr:TetR/AcrR family transcriptional regulator [Mycolicibacterium sp.]HPX37216.1 TetR/AcrR family transcriptional regulator [Mycobacterium sp.]HQC77454.1 TetR/AcrR family transcriptional regulator [Mycobacterium sp.]